MNLFGLRERMIMTKRKENTNSVKGYNNRNHFFYRSKPITDRELDQLAEELLNEVDSSEMLKITSFLTSRRISTSDYYSWLKRSERLRKAHNIALNIIGLRREVGGLNGDYNPTIVLRTLGYYDESYKAHFEEEAKSKEGLSSVPLKVVIERYGDIEE